MVRRAFIPVALFTCCIVAALAQDLPKLSRPEEAGFSSERLNRITQFFQSEVDQGKIPGAVLVVGRNGKMVYRQAVGYQDREKKSPMKVDSVFRIFSMTKPVTTVAVMMLAEEGKIDVMAPVAQYLPEFKDVKVGVESMDPAGGKPMLNLEAPVRPMTVQDLLRHTSGLVYGPFGNTLVHQEYNKANLFDPGQTLAEFVTKISKLPLAHQPGTVWEYGMSTDVLARIVEVVSGMPFDRFLEERITKPLKMPDTAFYMEPARLQRVAQLQIDPKTGKRPEFGNPDDLTKEKVKWFSGGGGLLSTAIRLFSFLPDAGQWRRTRRCALALAEDAGGDDLGSSACPCATRRRTAGDSGSKSVSRNWTELRAWICSAHRSGTLPGFGFRRRLFLGGGGGDVFLDRSAGEAVRGHDAADALRRSRTGPARAARDCLWRFSALIKKECPYLSGLLEASPSTLGTCLVSGCRGWLLPREDAYS